MCHNPAASNLIYHHEPELTPKEIVDKALSYQPIVMLDSGIMSLTILSSEPSDIRRMNNGCSPKVPLNQVTGKLDTYQLHHNKPIHQGGAVYNLGNITIVTPLYHRSILERVYHYGK